MTSIVRSRFSRLLYFSLYLCSCPCIIVSCKYILIFLFLFLLLFFFHLGVSFLFGTKRKRAAVKSSTLPCTTLTAIVGQVSQVGTLDSQNALVVFLDCVDSSTKYKGNMETMARYGERFWEVDKICKLSEGKKGILSSLSFMFCFEGQSDNQNWGPSESFFKDVFP